MMSGLKLATWEIIRGLRASERGTFLYHGHGKLKSEKARKHQQKQENCGEEQTRPLEDILLGRLYQNNYLQEPITFAP